MKVNIYKEQNYPIDEERVKKILTEELLKQGINSDFFISVAFVEEPKMDELVRAYYKREGADFGNRPHPILTFPTKEMNDRFVFPPDGPSDLGEIVISYPQALDKSTQSSESVEDIILSLVRHGARHLVGIHDS